MRGGSISAHGQSLNPSRSIEIEYQPISDSRSQPRISGANDSKPAVDDTKTAFRVSCGSSLFHDNNDFESSPMMSHQAYFEFLAGSDHSAPAWDPVLGGLAVLRLIDSRLGRVTDAKNDWASFESARNAVVALSQGDPVRSILLQLIDSVSIDDINREAIGR